MEHTPPRQKAPTPNQTLSDEKEEENRTQRFLTTLLGPIGGERSLFVETTNVTGEEEVK